MAKRPILDESTTLLELVVANADATALRQMADASLQMLIVLILALRERFPAEHDAWLLELRRVGLNLEGDLPPAARGRES